MNQLNTYLFHTKIPINKDCTIEIIDKKVILIDTTENFMMMELKILQL